MKKLLLTYCFLPICLLAQQADTTIYLTTSTGTIEGTLLTPLKKKNTPLVLIISGSGPTDRDGNNPMMKNNSLKMLAEGLLENNIASIRYDKRGIGKSKSAGIKEADLRFEDYINDVTAWVDTLKQNERFSKIIILGHSEGSTIGMIASQNKAVSKFISVAGPGTKADEKIKEQLNSQPPFIKKHAFPILEKLAKGDTVGTIPPILFSLFRPSVQPYMISWFKYNPQHEIQKLDKPVLIIQGTTDIQVSISDAELLAKNNPKAKKVILENMNHVLKKSEKERLANMKTYSNPTLPLKKGLVDEIIRFIEE